MIPPGKHANTYLGLIGLLKPEITAGDTPQELIGAILPHAVPETGLARETRLYTDPSGSRLRITFDEHGQPAAGHPSFPAAGALRARLRGFSPRPGDTYAEAHAVYEVFDGETLLYPVVATVADPHALAGWKQDASGTLQLTVFPHRAEVFASAEEFATHQQAEAPDRPHFSAKAFVPTGINERAPGQPPQPSGMFTGIVRSAESRTVQLTGQGVTLVELETHGGTLSLVANRDAFSVLPAPGNVMRARGWLTGQFSPDLN